MNAATRIRNDPFSAAAPLVANRPLADRSLEVIVVEGRTRDVGSRT